MGNLYLGEPNHPEVVNDTVTHRQYICFIRYNTFKLT